MTGECAWCGAPGAHQWEHRRQVPHGYVAWFPACDRCHRWLTRGTDDNHRRKDPA